MLAQTAVRGDLWIHRSWIRLMYLADPLGELGQPFNGWVDGSGSNPGGGFGKPRGGHETRDGDGLEGPGGKLSIVVT
ncbi:hypothetical protein Tco_0219078 [Tanacetum coccineum]